MYTYAQTTTNQSHFNENWAYLLKKKNTFSFNWKKALMFENRNGKNFQFDYGQAWAWLFLVQVRCYLHLLLQLCLVRIIKYTEVGWIRISLYWHLQCRPKGPWNHHKNHVSCSETSERSQICIHRNFSVRIGKNLLLNQWHEDSQSLQASKICHMQKMSFSKTIVTIQGEMRAMLCSKLANKLSLPHHKWVSSGLGWMRPVKMLQEFQSFPLVSRSLA